MKITEFKTLQAKDPIGTGNAPYFSWKINSEKNNTCQASYQLLIKNAAQNICMGHRPSQ